MKTLNNNIAVAFLIIISALLYSCINVKKLTDDKKSDAVTIKNMIDNRSFVFVPQYVNPLGISRRHLTGGFEISISKDTIVSYLPYFGRAYTAPLSPSDVDYDFTSTKFTYAITSVANGWHISIKPKDQNYLQELYFKIFDNGAASLNITSINKSALSYDGYIKARKK